MTCTNSVSSQIGPGAARWANAKYAPAAANEKTTSRERPMMSLVKRDDKNAMTIYGTMIIAPSTSKPTNI